MKRIMHGWHLMRVLRLAMGIVAIGFAIEQREWILGISGGLLIAMAVGGAGCCGPAGCSFTPPDVPQKRTAAEEDAK